ncbi:MAG: methionine synthase [Omnitrophica bacterium RIFCSPLOWO2_12_FULL_44_17]|uniref:Methionine synthase n=1 Tax=Candidatus Danuiimicrobium aquiferis TaxID=1801832 RepID=A0A1G1L1Z7_9BACT|nr:MAG: methionine synthase [Omnitrophica bacterium RIFCSPHIGHO2_02_FULL_45_28]OGW88253.1 MAG: methionine synthase [Omnitrophica bacterium RIFCSPHIGHO2_12_FULL_44_12]OGW99138.1 MAG: methionine synthase [Omnitrophica bacterium RIFCSPLOWO2_12_FULL_44_17]OGX03167.1 MAG: methionine synthase [Omnitrophica bacterium RIFCSPLOWO2_02_FULL_44_11]
MILPTTSVGSFPKPEYLTEARSRFSKGEMSKEELHGLERKATEEWIRFQDEIGMDVLVDGEMYRGDMVTYFAENLHGFQISGLVRSYGNRYYRKPVAVAEIQRVNPVTVEWFKYVQSLTRKPVKGMLTGPYTIMDWSFNEYYSSRRDFCLRLAELIHQEAIDLQNAGAQYIQIDEPAISVRPDELDLAIEAMEIVTKDLTAKTITHICYGNFPQIYPKMLELSVNQIDLEMCNSSYELMSLFRRHPFTKEIGLGVIDVHNHKIETKEDVRLRIKKALTVLPLEKVYISPDCGLKTRTIEESHGKLRVMVDAVKELREELALISH